MLDLLASFFCWALGSQPAGTNCHWCLPAMISSPLQDYSHFHLRQISNVSQSDIPLIYCYIQVWVYMLALLQHCKRYFFFFSLYCWLLNSAYHLLDLTSIYNELKEALGLYLFQSCNKLLSILIIYLIELTTALKWHSFISLNNIKG